MDYNRSSPKKVAIPPLPNKPSANTSVKPSAKPVIAVPPMVKARGQIQNKQPEDTTNKQQVTTPLSAINKPLPPVPTALPKAPAAPVPTALAKAPAITSSTKPKLQPIVRHPPSPEKTKVTVSTTNSKVSNTKSSNNKSSPNKVPIEPESPVPLVLDDIQKPWAARSNSIIQENYGYIDTSPPGAGKTIMTIHNSLETGLKLVIICLVSLIDNWKREAAKYGAEILTIISYESLASRTGCQPKCDLITRTDRYTEKGGIHKVEFKATQKYLDMVEAGILLVCDEFFKIKNVNDKEKAVKALMEPIVTTSSFSRYAFLTASPFDKEKHAVNFLKLTGYIESTNMYNMDNGVMTYEGLQDLIDRCNLINKPLTTEIMSTKKFSSKPTKQIEICCLELYAKVIKPQISGSMPCKIIEGITLDIANGFYNISEHKASELRKAIDTLSKELEGAKGLQAFKSMMKTAQCIERAKLFDVARVATNKLEEVEGSKVIICVSYLDSLKELEKLLIMYNPVILQGKVPQAKRMSIIDEFNENPECRVIIMITKVGGVGINLHDTVGNAPRFQYIMPSFNLIEISQATGRAYRFGTLSNVEVRLFYGKETGKQEIECIDKLLKYKENLDKKSEIMKMLLDEGSRITLPSDYKTYVEP